MTAAAALGLANTWSRAKRIVVPPGRPGMPPHMAKISDLNMLAMMGGQERTEAEWCELLTDAGYAGISNRPTGTPFSVIEATVR